MSTPNNNSINIGKAGMPPGTVIYSGEASSERVKITLIEYSETTFVEKEFYDLSSCFNHIDPALVKWINVDGIHKVELIEAIGQQYNIHPLTLEDIAHISQRPKFEDYDNYVVAILKMIYYDSEFDSEQLSILLMEGMVISFQEVNGDVFDVIRNRLRSGKGKIRSLKADYLAYALLDAVVDSYFSILEKMGDKIELLEDELIESPTKKTMQELHNIKREIILLRKSVWPVRELINNLERSETKLIEPTTDVYLRDLHDHAIRVIDTIETYRDMLAGMMDIYLSSVSNKMNEVMKVLTIITTIFVPVTFIAGIYGMNFDHMPELHSQYGYSVTWGVMIVIILSLILYFRKKKWL